MLVWFGEWFDLDNTLIVGVLSFATATIACVIAASRSPTSEARTWITLACVNGVFTLDLLTKARYLLHNFVDRVLVAHSLYQYRTFPQQAIIATLAAIFLICAVIVLARSASKSRAARVASTMVVAFVGLFGIEGISLHAIDYVLWRNLGYIKVIGLIWAAGAAVITLAAIWRAARGPELEVTCTRIR